MISVKRTFQWLEKKVTTKEETNYSVIREKESLEMNWHNEMKLYSPDKKKTN